MDQALDAGHEAAASEADIAFHEKLVELAASLRLSRTHATLVSETRMCLNRLQVGYETEAGRVVEHRGLPKPFAAGNAICWICWTRTGRMTWHG